MESNVCRIAGILLAAGGSTRLGSPKQLLCYQGQTLLRRAAEAILHTNCEPVIAVLGARADECHAEIGNLPGICTIENAGWQRGMGSSLRLGLEAALANASDTNPLTGILLTLCDQPLVDSVALSSLLARFHPVRHPIIAAAYGGTIGVPAVFSAHYFSDLQAVADIAGAKSLLLAHRAFVTKMPLPQAAVDVDTSEQYTELQNVSGGEASG